MELFSQVSDRVNTLNLPISLMKGNTSFSGNLFCFSVGTVPLSPAVSLAASTIMSLFHSVFN